MRKRALISVSDKSGVAVFAERLVKAGYEILSTGGTAKLLLSEGIEVTEVTEVTGFPECFGGRVKTMHPKIMGGILMRRTDAKDVKEARELGVEPIDLVVVNLYPFEDAYDKGLEGDALIEQIDIGGPTLLRSAAKNHAHVTVVCDIADYDRVAEQIEKNGDTSQELRAELAAKVFFRTATYDAAITEALSEGKNRGLLLSGGMRLRYGENPHQWGMYYDHCGGDRGWTVLQEEKKMSYLNLLDADAAWNLVREFAEPTAACIKHANPSGVASALTIEEAFQKSYDTDKLSAFGVIIALNRPCTEAVIRKVIDQKIFAEVIIAPAFEGGALKYLKEKPKIRAIECSSSPASKILYRSALGGMLVQGRDDRVLTVDDLKVITNVQPTAKQVDDLLFAWNVVKHSKSNAIVFAKDRTTVGIGAGQTSRVDAVWIAAKRAGDRAKGAVMASDAFFPFPDSVEEAANHGIAAVIQPGGSMRDEEVIAKANALKLPMVTTGVRAFWH